MVTRFRAYDRFGPLAFTRNRVPDSITATAPIMRFRRVTGVSTWSYYLIYPAITDPSCPRSHDPLPYIYVGPSTRDSCRSKKFREGFGTSKRTDPVTEQLTKPRTMESPTTNRFAHSSPPMLQAEWYTLPTTTLNADGTTSGALSRPSLRNIRLPLNAERSCGSPGTVLFETRLSIRPTGSISSLSMHVNFREGIRVGPS